MTVIAKPVTGRPDANTAVHWFHPNIFSTGVRSS